MFATLVGLPAFLAYFCVSLIVVVGYLYLYTHLTPHDEFELIRKNVPGAAISLGLSLLGFSLPVALGELTSPDAAHSVQRARRLARDRRKSRI